ncbi:MAG: hypothetical protein ACK2T4_09060 [Candidatus Promineifilaceae bacterium]|jgi:uncharacterized protein YcfL
MRKYLILALLILLLAACGSTTGSSTTTGEEATTAVDNSVTPTEEKDNNESTQTGSISVITGSTPEEASVVREQDHILGAEEPVVTIIEYGDFQ